MEAKFALFTVVAGKQVRIDLNKKEPKAPPDAFRFYVRYTDPETKTRVCTKIDGDFQKAKDYISRLNAGRVCQKAGLAMPANVPELPKPIPAGDRITDKIDEWIGVKKSKKTKQAYRRSVNLFRESCKAELVSKVEETDLNQFHIYLQKDEHHFADHTIYGHFLNTVSFLKFCKRQFENLTWPTFQDALPEEYTHDQIKALMAEAKGEERLILECLLFTGLRSGELATRRYADIQGTTFFIRTTRTHKNKTNESTRVVPVPQHLLDQILARKRESDFDYIFPTRNGKPQGHLLRIVKGIAKRLGWKISTRKNPDIGLRVDDHKFRSTAITNWIRKGKDLLEIQRLVGHANLETLQRYYAMVSAQSPKAQQEAAETFNFLLPEKTKPAPRKKVTPIRKRRAA